MKLVQLRSLIANVDNGLNITKAANQPHTSQAAISKRLGKLEEELGAQLFVRYGKKLAAITPAGKKAICHSRLIVREVKDITALMDLGAWLPLPSYDGTTFPPTENAVPQIYPRRNQLKYKKKQYRVRNGREYEAWLCKRGDLMI